ncbi:MAG TPA: DUF4175 family protein [Acidiphilium sp.]|nr:MAG: hypothetical protein B7Z67_10305 [Acidiphilium sp. 21-60-14]OYV90015.1 MAG: hypothetical protein B7Z57_10475 [Acidiphilium sp. 37-60-79]OZB39048.1 MAG: hypothetical protein B7X48_10530 [Acidiphilium sp. 34-60-192]HQT90012.1 DUF4175 family protein [Acidiphilium sp.]HQU25205.1 DUF4175 family protein [Acidiphilium sp.]
MREQLDAVRRRALLVLWSERLASVAMVPMAVLLGYVMLLLAGFSGGWLQIAGLVAMAGSLFWAARMVRRPGLAEADRRIERDSGLARWNLAMIEDRLVGAPGTALPAGTVQLFAAHRARLAREVARARVGAPELDLFSRDRFGLRALLLLGVVVLAVLAGPQAGPRLARGFLPPSLLGPRPQLQLWLTPPVWTGRAPRVLGAVKQVRVLAGSSLSLIITGVGRGDAGPPVRFAGVGLPSGPLGGGSFRARLAIERSGELQVGPFWRRLVRLRVMVRVPRAPVVAFAGMPMRDRDGREQIGWRIDSPYGVKDFSLRLRPVNQPVPRQKLAVPLPEQIVPLGARAAGVGRERVSLAASRYAGLPVRAVLSATNQRGMVGVSAPVRFRLPAPVLRNATAAQIFLLRQSLALHPSAGLAVGAGLARLGVQPPGKVTAATDLAIGVAAQRFAHGAVGHPFALLWRLMQQAEQGKGFRTAQRLAASRAALERALRRDIANGAVDQAALRRLVRRLEQASAAHLAAVGGAQAAQSAALQAQVNRAVEKLARRIAREAQAGETKRAAADLRRLDRMLSGLQHARPMSAAQAAQAQAREQAAQAAGRQLAQMIRAQSALLDQSTAMAHPVFSGMTPPGQVPLGPKAGAPTAGGAGPQNLAGAQAGLQQQAAALAQRMGAAHLAGVARLGAAAQAMAQAQAQLQAGDPAGAAPAQRAAIAALQQAAQATAQQQAGVQQQAGAQGQQSGSAPGSDAAGAGSHGGPPGPNGVGGGGALPLKRAGQGNAARRIERSLIKRDARPGLPAQAHDYYRRLLGKP